MKKFLLGTLVSLRLSLAAPASAADLAAAPLHQGAAADDRGDL